MSLVIRLRQQGRNNRRCFRLVLTEKRAPRDGKYQEMLGWYDPHLEGEKSLTVKTDRVKYWMEKGAQLSENAFALLAKVAPEITKEFVQRSILKKEKKRIKIKSKKPVAKTKK